MSSLIITANDAYESFLIGIRRQQTSGVPTSLFLWYWNDAAIIWVKSKLPTIEFVQKRIDDIDVLKTITDGSSIGYDPIAVVVNSDDFMLPLIYEKDSNGLLQSNVNGIRYPLYLHGLHASFYDSDGVIIPARLKRSDQFTVSLENHYMKPTVKRCFYEYVNGHLRFQGGTAVSMRLEYYRFPKMINIVTGGTNFNPEFNPLQNKEITEIAIKTFLENRMNPRYKSFLQEMMLKSQSV